MQTVYVYVVTMTS